MSRVPDAPDIINLANDLGLGGANDRVQAMLDSCLERIDHGVANAGGVTGIDALKSFVTRRRR